MPPKDYKGNYPTWYDPAQKCEFHMDGPGHSLENSFLLKHKIQDLIDSDQLKFRIVPPAGPNIAGNPLPAHGERKVNAIREGRRLVRRVEPLTTPLGILRN